jgi:hypothetical protein
LTTQFSNVETRILQGFSLCITVFFTSKKTIEAVVYYVDYVACEVLLRAVSNQSVPALPIVRRRSLLSKPTGIIEHSSSAWEGYPLLYHQSVHFSLNSRQKLQAHIYFVEE